MEIIKNFNDSSGETEESGGRKDWMQRGRGKKRRTRGGTGGDRRRMQFVASRHGCISVSLPGEMALHFSQDKASCVFVLQNVLNSMQPFSN